MNGHEAYHGHDESHGCRGRHGEVVHHGGFGHALGHHWGPGAAHPWGYHGECCPTPHRWAGHHSHCCCCDGFDDPEFLRAQKRILTAIVAEIDRRLAELEHGSGGRGAESSGPPDPPGGGR